MLPGVNHNIELSNSRLWAISSNLQIQHQRERASEFVAQKNIPEACKIYGKLLNDSNIDFTFSDKDPAVVLYQFGIYYRDGLSPVARDDDKAFQCFTLAHAQKYSKATFELGQMYWFGRGRPVDKPTALQYIESVAHQYIRAAFCTGEAYRSTQFMQPEKALQYFQIVTTAHDPTNHYADLKIQAERRLGELRQQGYGGSPATNFAQGSVSAISAASKFANPLMASSSSVTLWQAQANPNLPRVSSTLSKSSIHSAISAPTPVMGELEKQLFQIASNVDPNQDAMAIQNAVSALIQKGADITATDNEGLTVWHRFAQHKRVVFQLAINAIPQDKLLQLFKPDRQGNTLIMYLAEKLENSAALIHFLCNKLKEIDLSGQTLKNILTNNVNHQFETVLGIADRRKLDVVKSDLQPYCSRYRLTMESFKEFLGEGNPFKTKMREWIAAGVSFTATDKNKMTLLHCAIEHGDPDFVIEILKKIPDNQLLAVLQSVDNNRRTPYLLAEQMKSGSQKVAMNILDTVRKVLGVQSVAGVTNPNNLATASAFNYPSFIVKTLDGKTFHFEKSRTNSFEELLETIKEKVGTMTKLIGAGIHIQTETQFATHNYSVHGGAVFHVIG